MAGWEASGGCCCCWNRWGGKCGKGKGNGRAAGKGAAVGVAVAVVGTLGAVCVWIWPLNTGRLLLLG